MGQSTLPGVPRPDSPTSSDADLTAWLESLADTEIAEQRRAAKWSALNNLVLDCNRRISSAASDITRVLASLNAHLQALMDDVSAVVERLNGARTPNEVIAAGVGDAWRELFPLRQSYDKIRQGQEWTMLGRDELQNARSKYVDDPHASDAWIANLDDFFDGWREADRTFRLSGDAPRRQPWPAPGRVFGVGRRFGCTTVDSDYPSTGRAARRAPPPPESAAKTAAAARPGLDDTWRRG